MPPPPILPTAVAPTARSIYMYLRHNLIVFYNKLRRGYANDTEFFTRALITVIYTSAYRRANINRIVSLF